MLFKYSEILGICNSSKLQQGLPTSVDLGNPLGSLYPPQIFVGHGKGPVKLKMPWIIDARLPFP